MLRAQKLEKILNSDEYRCALREFADGLSVTATGAPNEKTIEAWFDLRMGGLFEKWFKPIGYYYEPTKEETVRTVRKQTGRADTSIGTVVIEFKQPQTLSSEKDKEQALAQACDYIEGFNSAGLNKTFGMVTDGTKAAIIYMQAGGEPRMEPFLPLGWQHLDKLVKAIIGLRQKQLSPENLVKDFASRPSSPARALASCLFTILQERPSNRTKMLLSEWKHLFKLSHNDVSQQRDLLERRKALASFLDAAINSVEQEYNALFSLQTAYTVLIKLLAFKAISQVKYEDTLVNFSELAASDDSALLMQMDNLESGAIIRDYGIQNLLEGDFFSWYTAVDQWCNATAAHIRDMAGRLDEYKATDIFSGATHAQDFFKLLYYSMMPKQVRHALGEYYTPKWLAKRTVEQALVLLGNTAGWRALDPTCGSGTFLTALIEKVSEETLAQGKERAEILHEITRRVAGIDMNPLAVLTARVNYFLNIAHYITPSTHVEIPVYSGDSAYKPEKTVLNGVDFVKYTLDTEIMPFEYYFPASALKNLAKFSAAMTEIELDIKTENLDAIRRRLLELVPAGERGNAAVIEKIEKLASTFILFEKKNWNGIWARIITNYLSASEIGKFDIIVGNPPWVDWKNLPSAYRERIKSLEITKTIFSGDTFSGGINLNIAALIINTAIQNWLERDGVLGMLMPDAFLIQQTYEGFRRLILNDGSRAHFIHFDDWRNAGHPFAPVTQKFVGGFISRKAPASTSGIPVARFTRNKGARVDAETLDFGAAFSCSQAVAIQPNPDKTNLVITSPQNTESHALIGASKSQYRGREGMRFFPLELLLFTLDKTSSMSGDKIRVENIQNPRSQHHVPRQKRLFERDALRPLVRSRDVQPFHIAWSGIIVPFLFDPTYSTRAALPEEEVRARWPNVYRFLIANREVFDSQSQFTGRLVLDKAAPFYSTARVGDYSFAPFHVVFRANSKPVAAVTHLIRMPWGDDMPPVFQDHAPTISQRPDGTWITEDEAFYIAGVMNAPSVRSYISQSSDSRSIPLNPRFQIPLYGTEGLQEFQQNIAALSKQAHQSWNDAEVLDSLRRRMDEAYLAMLRQLQKDGAYLKL